MGFSSGGYEAVYWYDTSGHDQGFNLLSYNTDYLITIKKENGNVLVYRDGTLRKTIYGTGAVVGQTLNIGERNWGSGTGTVKNIKIKPL